MSVAKGVVNTIKGALGIRSPSQVMADEVGQPIVTGLAKGMTGNFGLLATASKGRLSRRSSDHSRGSNLPSAVEATAQASAAVAI